jgi:hypothetical protein
VESESEPKLSISSVRVLFMPAKSRRHVFISHSSSDGSTASEICRLLEVQGIHCWMAPRDVRPGYDYDEEIVDAIDETEAMVLILSSHSNESIHVKHEVERAVSHGKAVFPVRIQEVLPSKKLVLHISTRQWIDAWKPPLEAKIEQLAAAIKGLLGLPESSELDKSSIAPLPASASSSIEEQSEKVETASAGDPWRDRSAVPPPEAELNKESSLQSETGFAGAVKKRLRRIPIKYAVTAGVVVLLGISVFLFNRRQQHTVGTSFQERLLATVPPEYKMADVPYDWEVDFASDGSKVAYTVRQNEKAFVVVGDNKQPEFNWVSKPVFSSIGSRMLYGAREGKEGKKLFVVVDGKRGPEFDNLDSRQKISFSADGNKVVYVMEKGAEWFVAIDDKLRPVEWGSFGPTLSADEKRLAYIVPQGPVTYSVMVDGRQGPVFDWISFPVFSPDSSRLAYVARRQGKYFVVVNDQQISQEFGNVETPVFSPDSSKLAFVGQSAQYGPPVQIVIGNDKGPEFAGAKLPTFSPDGKTVAYAAIRNVGKWFLVLGDKEGPQFDEIVKVVFSPDGRKVGYGVRNGRELWWKVMNLQ